MQARYNQKQQVNSSMLIVISNGHYLVYSVLSKIQYQPTPASIYSLHRFQALILHHTPIDDIQVDELKNLYNNNQNKNYLFQKMNPTANYLNYFIEACKSLQNIDETSVIPKSQEKINETELLSLDESQKIPALSEQKINPQVTKINLTEEDLIRYGTGTTKKYWNQKQDKILISLAQKYDCNWELIAEKLPGRNKKMCYSRYQRILLEAKDVWKPEQNGQIKRLYEKEKLSWRQISFYFPNRTAKQLREHYIGYLRPNINNSEWTIEEDLKLIALFNENGKRWKFFQSFFKGRTQNQLKNRYYGRLEKLHFKKMKEEGQTV